MAEKEKALSTDLKNLDLVGSTNKEKLLERVKERALERQEEAKRKKIHNKDLRIQRKQSAQRNKIWKLQKNFGRLLNNLTYDLLGIRSMGIPKEELIELPALIAAKTIPWALAQAATIIVSPFILIVLINMLLVPHPAIVVAGGIFTIIGSIVFGWITDFKYDVPFTKTFRSLSYAYYYYRIRKKLGHEGFIQYLEKADSNDLR